jgi:hypothetical protein
MLHCDRYHAPLNLAGNEPLFDYSPVSIFPINGNYYRFFFFLKSGSSFFDQMAFLTFRQETFPSEYSSTISKRKIKAEKAIYPMLLRETEERVLINFRQK